MEKYISDLIGYYGGDKVCLSENGVPVIVSTLEERINRRISVISLELNHINKIYHWYIERQAELRAFVKSDDFNKINFNKQERIKRYIRENRGILCGIQFYTKQLNHEKKHLQKINPRNMKKKI